MGHQTLLCPSGKNGIPKCRQVGTVQGSRKDCSPTLPIAGVIQSPLGGHREQDSSFVKSQSNRMALEMELHSGSYTFETNVAFQARPKDTTLEKRQIRAKRCLKMSEILVCTHACTKPQQLPSLGLFSPYNMSIKILEINILHRSLKSKSLVYKF
jgi:hypothetical protein